MANSINTNAGALIALQNLNATNRDLNVTQNRVNTGLKVSTAKDNGAIFAIATSQRAEMGALDSVKQSIQRGQSIVDVALAAGEIVTKALEEQKGLAVAIASSTGDAQTAYLADFNALGNEITKALGGASFDGVNLFKANAAAVDVRTGTGAGDTFTVKAIAGADTAVFTAVLGDLGTKSKSMDRQLTFVSKMQDSLEVGIGNLVDADLAKESARLTALQTKQQLGVQALSIANQSSSILLGLFR
jgi:flagellin